MPIKSKNNLHEIETAPLKLRPKIIQTRSENVCRLGYQVNNSTEALTTIRLI